MEAAMAAQERTGFVFRDAITEDYYEALRAELAERHGDPDMFTAGIDSEQPDEAPWADLDPGVSRRFLVREWNRCLEFVQTPVCLGWVDEPGKCQACGACTPPEREAITHARMEPAQDLDALDRRLKRLRETESVVAVQVELSDACIGLPMDMVHAWHARAWMKVLDVAREYRKHQPHGRADDGPDCLASGLETLNPVFWFETAERVREALRDGSVLERVNELFAPYGKVVGEVPTEAPSGEWELRWTRAPDLSGWLASRGLKHTMRRDGDVRVLDLPKESLKKKIVSSMWCQELSDGAWLVRFGTGDKFSAKEFLRGTCPGPEWVYAKLRRVS
jgi:hypothetical protein